MVIDTFANRLQKAMKLKNMKQVDLVEKTNIDKSLISNYLKGKYKAKQDNLFLLAKVLDVNEAWLMGYDVSMERISNNSEDTFRTASYNGIDVEGLDEDEIQHLNELAEFYRSKKKK
ncbi:MAG: helix-turn-helix domain-containing protein [Monoglobales bacterium]